MCLVQVYLHQKSIGKTDHLEKVHGLIEVVFSTGLTHTVFYPLKRQEKMHLKNYFC